MPSERLHPNPLSGVYRLLTSRGTHLVIGVLTVLAVLFSGYDATRMRPSDGTVWLLGRPDLEVLDILERTSDPGMEAKPVDKEYYLERGDRIIGIGSTFVKSPQHAASILSK